MRRTARAIALLALVSWSAAAQQGGLTQPMEAAIERLNNALLQSRSATATLEAWCADHRMADPARIVAIADSKAEKPATPETREALDVGPNEPLRYRHVALMCGGHLFSRAENWYVPSRLTPEMNVTLDTTDTPFGRVIAPLKPERRTLSVDRLWTAMPDGGIAPSRGNDGAPQIPTPLFRHRAVVLDSQHRPIALVIETYTHDVLDFVH